MSHGSAHGYHVDLGTNCHFWRFFFNGNGRTDIRTYGNTNTDAGTDRPSHTDSRAHLKIEIERLYGPMNARVKREFLHPL